MSPVGPSANDRLICVWLEEKVNGEWTRPTRFPRPMHPSYAKNLVRDLKRIHKSAEYRLVEEQDDDIPF